MWISPVMTFNKVSVCADIYSAFWIHASLLDTHVYLLQTENNVGFIVLYCENLLCPCVVWLPTLEHISHISGLYITANTNSNANHPTDLYRHTLLHGRAQSPDLNVADNPNNTQSHTHSLTTRSGGQLMALLHCPLQSFIFAVSFEHLNKSSLQMLALDYSSRGCYITFCKSVCICQIGTEESECENK